MNADEKRYNFLEDKDCTYFINQSDLEGSKMEQKRISQTTPKKNKQKWARKITQKLTRKQHLERKPLKN